MNSAQEKHALDSAAAEYQEFKLALARQQRAAGAPERLAAAREQISSATDRRGLEAAFQSAVRGLRR